VLDESDLGTAEEGLGEAAEGLKVLFTGESKSMLDLHRRRLTCW
jgi:hypothetical protein